MSVIACRRGCLCGVLCNVFILLCFCSSAWAQPGYWTQNTARVLPAKRGEVMLLGASRYAYRERVEMGASLFAFAVLPNVQLKWALLDQPDAELEGGWAVAFRNRVFLPGQMYSFLGESTASTPWSAQVAVDGDMLMTWGRGGQLITMRMGGVWSYRRADSATTQLPWFLWHRAPVRDDERSVWMVRGGASLRQHVGREGWFVQADGDIHLLPETRYTGLELGWSVGVERRHLFAQFGGRSMYDGALSTMPVLEFGVALE